MSGLSPSPVGDIARRSWLDVLPWLGAHRQGPPLLGEGELMANAWMSTAPGDSVSDEHLAEICRRLATVFIEHHRGLAPAEAFPFAFPAEDADLSWLGLRERTVATLTAAGVTESGALGALTVDGLAGLRRVGPAVVAEVVTALVRRSVSADTATSAAVDEVERFVAPLGERDRFLLTARILGDRRVTLAECGTALGISRERVNQLDNRLRERVHAAFHSSAPLRAAADALVAAAQPVAALDRLIAVTPELGTVAPSAGVPLWFVLTRLDQRVDAVDGWVVAETIDAARSRVKGLLAQLAGDEGLVALTEIAAHLGIPEAETATWLAYSGYRIVDGQVLTRSGSVHDSVAAILALAGEPMTLNEIHAAVVPARSLSSVRNAMVSDERFVKTDRARWGLARWGTSRYVPIHRQIGEILDARGGSIPVDELVERLTTEFGVKEFSVRTYAASGGYTTVDGVVTRRKQTYKPRKSPTKTRHLYREGEVLRWRTTVAAPHAKGSAFNLPTALAGLVGAGPDRSVELTSRLGPQSILWVAVQARSGTIKRFLDDLGLVPGDDIFLEFVPDAEDRPQFDVLPAPPLPDSGSPAHRVLAATGHANAADLSEPAALAALAESLWLPPSSDRAAIAAALRGRKEDELAEILTGSR